MAGADSWLYPASDRLVECEVGRKNGRLAELRFAEFFIWAGDLEREEVVAEHARGAVEQILRAGRLDRNVGAHADGLRTLARKNDAYAHAPLGLIWCGCGVGMIVFDFHDLATGVRAAFAAREMRTLGLVTLRALDRRDGFQFPVGRSAAARFTARRFPFWVCHVSLRFLRCCRCRCRCYRRTGRRLNSRRRSRTGPCSHPCIADPSAERSGRPAARDPRYRACRR